VKDVVIAILAKDKAYCLDFYLNCIYNQDFDKNRIHLYIRTNDNTDNTEEILETFIQEYGSEYASVYYNNESINEAIKNDKEHDWTYERLDIMAKVRQESIEYTKEKGAHYFVVDCDNFIVSDTLTSLYNDRKIGVVAPLLKLTKHNYYGNLHSKVCENGYMDPDEKHYLDIIFGDIKGKIMVDLVHCTYFIDNSLLDDVEYDDGTQRMEYVMFSDVLRKKGIPQYIDNTKFWGFLALLDCDYGYAKDEWQKFIHDNWQSEYLEMMGYES